MINSRRLIRRPPIVELQPIEQKLMGSIPLLSMGGKAIPAIPSLENSMNLYVNPQSDSVHYFKKGGKVRVKASAKSSAKASAKAKAVSVKNSIKINISTGKKKGGMKSSAPRLLPPSMSFRPQMSSIRPNYIPSSEHVGSSSNPLRFVQPSGVESYLLKNREFNNMPIEQVRRTEPVNLDSDLRKAHRLEDEEKKSVANNASEKEREARQRAIMERSNNRFNENRPVIVSPGITKIEEEYYHPSELPRVEDRERSRSKLRDQVPGRIKYGEALRYAEEDEKDGGLRTYYLATNLGLKVSKKTNALDLLDHIAETDYFPEKN